MKIAKTKEFLNSLVCSNGKNEKVSFFNLRRVLTALAIENPELEKNRNLENKISDFQEKPEESFDYIPFKKQVSTFQAGDIVEIKKLPLKNDGSLGTIGDFGVVLYICNYDCYPIVVFLFRTKKEVLFEVDELALVHKLELHHE